MPKQDKKKTRRGKRSQDWEALPPLNQNAAGIDVGKAEHYVAVPAGRDAEPVQKFGSFTADMHRMAGWLKACGIQTVAMQATGVYFALSSALIGRVQVPPALR
jgi:transposase